jgi:hypothetical protein
MQGHSRAAVRNSGQSAGAKRLRLIINPPQLQLDDRTVIFKYTGDGGWFCASFGDGAKYMRAAKEDPALRARIASRAETIRRNRHALGPDLARVMAAVELAKDYDPDQARDDHGRWTSEGAAVGGAASAALMYSSEIYADGLQQIGAQVLGAAARALPAVAATVGDLAAAAVLPATAFFGTLFVPAPRGLATSDGPISDAPGYSYHFDQEAGHLTITHRFDDGTSETVFDGRYDKDGVFCDNNGNAIGRFLGDSVAIDADAVRGYEARRRSDAQAAPGAIVQTDAATRSDPKVCPDPGPDKSGFKSPGAIAYQMYVGQVVNGEPLPPGIGIRTVRPNGWPVYFDDCNRSDGTLIEAKGFGYSDAMNSGKFYPWNGMYDDMMDQSERQLEAAKGRPITWYFAEKDVADRMREVFAKERPGIKVEYLPPPRGLIGQLKRIAEGGWREFPNFVDMLSQWQRS